MRPIYTADCETDPFKAGRLPQPFIWGLYSENFYKKFDSTEEFVNYIKDKEVIIYAHNGGKFDWHFLLWAIDEFSEISVINGRLAKFKVGAAELRDSYCILPVPLSAYKKDDFNYDLLEPDVRHLHMPVIEEYLKNDCIYLYDLVKRFIDDYGLNLTLAGSALKQWQKICEEKPPKTNQAFYHRFKPFYYGGRVQAFELGEIERDFSLIDINSAYPAAMCNYHPYGDNYLVDDKLPETDAEIARAFITLTCVSRGALPFRADDGSLTFPDDNRKREYTITGHEYLAGIRTKTIKNVKIIEVVTFAEFISFTQYVDHFFAMKAECKDVDPAGYLIAKLYLNSLYGKFAANPEEYKNYMLVEPCHLLSAERTGYDFVTQVDKWALVGRDLDESEMRYYNVATAASITGWVRAYLWEAICKCDKVMYCDTDSIMCVGTGDIELDKTKLGAWDVEAECDYAAISGKKLYAIHKKNAKDGKPWKTASKGAKLSHLELIRLAKGERVTYASIAPTYSIKKNPTFLTRTLAKAN